MDFTPVIPDPQWLYRRCKRLGWKFVPAQLIPHYIPFADRKQHADQKEEEITRGLLARFSGIQVVQAYACVPNLPEEQRDICNLELKEAHSLHLLLYQMVKRGTHSIEHAAKELGVNLTAAKLYLAELDGPPVDIPPPPPPCMKVPQPPAPRERKPRRPYNRQVVGITTNGDEPPLEHITDEERQKRAYKGVAPFAALLLTIMGGALAQGPKSSE
jgi:hypothetical protein